MEVKKVALPISESDKFEILELSLKVGPASHGTLLHKFILEDIVNCSEDIKKAAKQLKDMFNVLSVRAAVRRKQNIENGGLTEEETRTALIDPVVEILLRMSGREFVREEWKFPDYRRDRYDYFLRGKDEHVGVVLEAKKLSRNILLSNKDINSTFKGQVSRYLGSSSDIDGFGMVMLTNGSQLCVFLSCHIDGDIQPMRNFTLPIFSMSYMDSTIENCTILAYLIKYALCDHKVIKKVIEKACKNKMNEINRAAKTVEVMENGN